MDQLSTKLLIETYCQARALQLDGEFIAMIEKTLRQRSILVSRPSAKTIAAKPRKQRH